MAINRSKIARQLLAQGGVSLNDAQMMAPDGEFLAYINPKEANMLKQAGGSGIMTPMGIPSFVEYGTDDPGTMSQASASQDQVDSFSGGDGPLASEVSYVPKQKPPANVPGDDLNILERFRLNSLKNQIDYLYGNKSLFNLMNPLGKPGLNPDFYGSNPNIVNEFGKGKDMTRADRIQAAINKAQTTGTLTQSEFEKAFGIDNTKGGGGEGDGDNNPVPIIPRIAQLPTDIEPEKSDYNEFVQRFTLPETYRLADGGEVRQEYGLGSIVKKAVGAVKKVAKSDLGKAAIAVGLGAYGMGAGPFANVAGSGFLKNIAVPEFLKSEALKNFFIKDGGGLTGKGLATLGIGATSLLAGAMTPKEEQESLSERIADRTGLDIEGIRKEVQEAYASGNTASLRNKYPFLITQSAAAAEGGRIGFADGTQGDEIIEEKGLPRLRNMPEFKGDEVKPSDMMMASNIENDAILENLFEKYLDLGFSPEDAAKKAREEFDRMGMKQGIERTMVAEGGMMNLGGNEMDLRGGGFVPIGVAEKADDVPARLSKNEFVFTADAVRAAGGGSVDKGADLMYKTMKQLENKVA